MSNYKIFVLVKKLLIKIKLFFFFWQNAFWKNPVNKILLGLALVLNVSEWAVPLFFWKKKKEQIILHYNAHFGVDLFGDWRQIIVLPVTGFIFIVINSWLSNYFYQRGEFLVSHVLLLINIFVQIGLIIALAGLFLVNY